MPPVACPLPAFASHSTVHYVTHLKTLTGLACCCCLCGEAVGSLILYLRSHGMTCFPASCTYPSRSLLADRPKWISLGKSVHIGCNHKAASRRTIFNAHHATKRTESAVAFKPGYGSVRRQACHLPFHHLPFTTNNKPTPTPRPCHLFASLALFASVKCAVCGNNVFRIGLTDGGGRLDVGWTWVEYLQSLIHHFTQHVISRPVAFGLRTTRSCPGSRSDPTNPPSYDRRDIRVACKQYRVNSDLICRTDQEQIQPASQISHVLCRV